MTTSEPATESSRARVPALLRYRGLEREALMAARLADVESLAAAIQLVLDDLQSILGERFDWPDMSINGSPQNIGHLVHGPGPDAFPLRHLHLVEAVLETALSNVRTGARKAHEHLQEAVKAGDSSDSPYGARTPFEE